MKKCLLLLLLAALFIPFFAFAEETPVIINKITDPDTKKYRIGGVDEYGRSLPEFEIDATELESKIRVR